LDNPDRLWERAMRAMFVGAVAGVLMGAAAAQAAGDAAAGKEVQRQFTFHYGATIGGLPAGKLVRVWLPVPPTNEDQTVRTRRVPEGARAGVEPKYGNHMVYLERAATGDGTVTLECVYDVQRREVKGGNGAAISADEAKQFLQPDAKVPVGGKSLTLLEGRTLPEDPLRLGRVLYDVVDDHMTYRKDKPGWGTGDSDWACDSKFGNCTDFHSLFISLARAKGLPAKFEIGFLLGPESKTPAKVAGYHCWAKFKPGTADAAAGWVPVDISEANQHPEERDLDFGTLTANRVMFTVGRDLTLSPAQAAGPLNFFVYPYVEVDGTVWPQDKIAKAFSYEDVPAAGDGAATKPAAGETSR
jgi:transglutaminase-like putative cysteine protease